VTGQQAERPQQRDRPPHDGERRGASMEPPAFLGMEARQHGGTVARTGAGRIG
jgi:hypothetical protein